MFCSPDTLVRLWDLYMQIYSLFIFPSSLSRKVPNNNTHSIKSYLLSDLLPQSKWINQIDTPLLETYQLFHIAFRTSSNILTSTTHLAVLWTLPTSPVPTPNTHSQLYSHYFAALNEPVFFSHWKLGDAGTFTGTLFTLHYTISESSFGFQLK